VKVRYVNPDLEKLEFDPAFSYRLGADIVSAYRKCMQLIHDARDENDLYAFRSRRFKKLQGDRAHQHSLRLNDQWRLIVEIETGNPKNTLCIIAIEDYH
jgi:proteic killer suppression protein